MSGSYGYLINLIYSIEMLGFHYINYLTKVFSFSRFILKKWLIFLGGVILFFFRNIESFMSLLID